MAAQSAALIKASSRYLIKYRLVELHVVRGPATAILTLEPRPELRNQAMGSQQHTMNDLAAPHKTKGATDAVPRSRQPIRLAVLICIYIVVYCVSFRMGFPRYRESYILYDSARLHYAIATIVAFAGLVPLFVFARFSFGYLTGFYFYSMILGYLWLNSFSQFQYDHTVAAVSAAVSAVAFLLPALLITSPIKRPYMISERSFVRLMACIVLFCAATAVAAAVYNFRIVAVADIYEFRGQLQFPTMLNYSIGAVTSVLLPFAFAYFFTQDKWWQAGIVLLISLSFYPSTLSKLALFTPAWLITLALISRMFEARTTVILSLLLPILAGVILINTIGEPMQRYFDIVNFRMIMVPSSAMDIYNEYFARHDLTHFCQIWLLKPFVSCALELPLAVEMQNNYVLGNFNASLFATEGIASVGLIFAPLSVVVCGLIIALGNRLSSGLPSHFILISSGIFPQILLNVPFSTVLLTHGLWILFLLWYVTPRTLFEQQLAS
jgi:hypothetical protein